MFLAGIYRHDRFAIITEPADDLVRPVHDRMPLQIAREEMQEWLDGGREFSPVPLVKEQDVEELPLW